jgi:hypothetical protein
MGGLHKYIGLIGGKKFVVIIAGIVMWYLTKNPNTAPIVAEVGKAVDKAQEIGSSSGSVSDLAVMISAYLLSQGFADGFSSGRTSSVAALKEEEKKPV